MIDTTFDVYSDTPPGKDPDQRSPTLRRFHAHLWSKPLPNGHPFELSVKTAGAYLHHSSKSGEFCLSSDSIANTYKYAKPHAEIIAQVPESEVDCFFSLASTIGAYIIFPSRTIDRKPTINGARGMHPRIGDRFDLTLECIRLYYEGRDSPLSDALARYQPFFNLFLDFQGYIDFFLLQDLLSKDTSQVKFFLPHADFNSTPYPTSLDTYRTYKKAVEAFIVARNKRIANLGVKVEMQKPEPHNLA